MLQSIRDHTQGWIAGVIISLLILSFALWGISSYIGGGSANPVVAEVNGVEITQAELSIAFERIRRQMQMQDPKTSSTIALDADSKQRALQSLINIQVLSQASLAQKYRISSAQVDTLLESMPEFQVNGQFSSSRFQQILSATLFSAKDFLNLIQKSLLIDQPRLGLIFTSFALPDEITQNLALVGQERNVQYLLLPFQHFANATNFQASQEDIHAYYKAHENEFKTPEQVSIDYIELSLGKLISTITVSDQELLNYFNENVNSFLEANKKTTPTFEQVKDKVRAAFLRQKAIEKLSTMKEKMANITYEHPDSLVPAAKELGLVIQTSELFAKDKAGKDITSHTKIREAAFTHDVLNLQNNSDLIQVSPDSVLVLRVKSHVPASTLPLNAVEKQIAETLKNKMLEEHLSKLAGELVTKLQTGNTDLSAISKQYNLTLVSPGFIGRHSSLVDPAILEAAFSIPKPQKTVVVYSSAQVSKGFAVVAVSAIRESTSIDAKQQHKVFGEQIQNAQGLLEYELYKKSMTDRAKIVVNN